MTGFAGGDPTSSTFGAAPGIQQTYQHGDDFSADRQRVEDSLMGRLNPSLAVERNKYEQQLSDQGIQYGSPAYDNAMRNYSMQANDARLGVIAQGGQEQQLQSQMAQQAGQFYNMAQQQAYEQAQGRGTFANQAAEQQYEQAFGRGQFYNAGQQQDFSQAAQQAQFQNSAVAQNFQQAQSAFNAQNAARQQYLSEQFALRNQPINEITSLLSGSQVSMPNFLNTSRPTIPTTDVAGTLHRCCDANSWRHHGHDRVVPGAPGAPQAAAVRWLSTSRRPIVNWQRWMPTGQPSREVTHESSPLPHRHNRRCD